MKDNFQRRAGSFTNTSQATFHKFAKNAESSCTCKIKKLYLRDQEQSINLT